MLKPARPKLSAPSKPPAEIAREAIRLLASRRLPPTPSNFSKAYEEVCGDTGTESPPGVAAVAEAEAPRPWGDTVRALLKQWDGRQSGLTQHKKHEMLERVLINFASDANRLEEKLAALARSWAGSGQAENVLDGGAEPLPSEEPARAEAESPSPAAPTAPGGAELLSALARHVALLADACAEAWPDIAESARRLHTDWSRPRGLDDAALNAAVLDAKVFDALGSLWRAVLARAEDERDLAAGLKRLVALLFLNIGELVGDEAWLAGQLAAIQNLLEGELHANVLIEAERSLRDLAYRQGMIKDSLEDAKAQLRALIDTFIDRIGEMSENAGGYHARIGAYSEKISQASDITELEDVVQGLFSDVAGLRDALRQSHEELLNARKEADAAQSRIQNLETELQQISALVREDQLTGALNRRGMEEAMARELARAERMDAPFSIGLLDIDHFKRLNDKLGHQAGDEALRHLARVVKRALRPMDTLARYGGEEFIILLPNTETAEATDILTRVQRALTREFFMHDNEKVLITFSAGVAQRQPDETDAALIARADAAMYRAKQSGRNRVEQA